jgi:heptosyltransferase-2
MILVTSLAGAIKQKYPDAEIDFVAGRHNHFVLHNNPNVRNVIVYEKSLGGIIRTIKRLRAEKYDFYCDPKDHFSNESRIIARIVRADTKIGFNPPDKKPVFDFPVDGDKANQGLHFALRAFKSLAPAGISFPSEVPKPELFVSADSESYVGEFLAKLPKLPLVVINISASAPKKMWSNHKWLDVIPSIDASKFNIVLSFAPSEKQAAESIAAEARQVNLFRSRSLSDVFSLIKAARLLVTPDTAVVHIAAAFDVPMVGLFSGLDDFFAKFAPLGKLSRVIRAPHGFDGVEPIEPEEVKKMIKELLPLPN